MKRNPHSYFSQTGPPGMHVFLGVCVFEPKCAWRVHPCGIDLGCLSLPFSVCCSFLRRLPELSSRFPTPPANALALLSSSPFPHLWLLLSLGRSEMSHCPTDPDSLTFPPAPTSLSVRDHVKEAI